MKTITRCLLCLACTAVAGARALKANNLTPPSMTHARAEVYSRVTARVLAPCCWSQPVQIHQSEAAERVRAEVVSYIGQGNDEQEILSRLAAEYGERILGEPRGAKGIVAYVTPFVVLAIGMAAMLAGLSRISRRKPQPVSFDGSLPDILELDV